MDRRSRVVSRVLMVALALAISVQVAPRAGAQDSPAEKPSMKWKPTGKQILDFIDKSLKSNIDRGTIEKVLDDISAGRAVFLPEKVAAAKAKAKGLASGSCIPMECRQLPCAVDYGNGWYGCSTCCIAAKTGRAMQCGKNFIADARLLP